MLLIALVATVHRILPNVWLEVAINVGVFGLCG